MITFLTLGILFESFFRWNLLSGNLAIAGQKVFLMTSISAPESRLDSHLEPQVKVDKLGPEGLGENSIESLELTFLNEVYRINDRFKQSDQQGSSTELPLLPRVVHHADQWDLATALSDPETVGLFWLSHGAGAACQKGFKQGGIYNWSGFEISPVFQLIQKNLEFLALISCYSESQVDQLKKDLESRGKFLPSLFAFSERILPAAGLQEALEKFQRQLGVDRPLIEQEETSAFRSGFIKPTEVAETPLEESQIVMRVTRHCLLPDEKSQGSPEISLEKQPATFPAFRIEDLDNRVLLVLPPCQRGESYTLERAIPAFPKPAAIQNVRLSFGLTFGQSSQYSQSKNYFGVIEISTSNHSLPWIPWTNSRGTPIGAHQRVFFEPGYEPIRENLHF